MAAHKKRNGELNVCYFCKQGSHKDCMNNDPRSAEYYVCHCSCQPACTRPSCNTKAGRVKRNWKAVACVTCHLIPCCCD